jgi:hypothetical protein
MTRLVGVSSVVALVWIASATAAAASPSPSPGEKITLSISSGPVDTLVTIAGSGFPRQTSFNVYLDSPDHTTVVASPARLSGWQTDADGSLRVDIYMPVGKYGQHSVCVQTPPVTACAPFAIEPSVTLTTKSGPPGTSLWMQGFGFPAGEIVTLLFEPPSTPLSTPGPFADAEGSFTPQPIRIPQGVVDGIHSVCGVTEHLVVKKCADFEVVNVPAGDRRIAVVADQASDGLALRVDGSGFPPSVPMSASIDGRQLAVFAANGALELTTDFQGAFHWTTVQWAFEYRDGSGRLIPLGNGAHTFCAFVQTSSAVNACALFPVLGAPTAASPSVAPTAASPSVAPIAASPSVASSAALATPSPPAGPPPTAIQDVANRLPIPVRWLGLAILILAAMGAVVWVRFSRSRNRGI